MTTKLEKTLKRELNIERATYTLTLTPQSIKITKKGHRRGQVLLWKDLMSGDAALAAALNASLARMRSK